MFLDKLLPCLKLYQPTSLFLKGASVTDTQTFRPYRYIRLRKDKNPTGLPSLPKVSPISFVRIMALTSPYTAYQGVGVPITFVVGPTTSSTRFDVHHSLLSKVSPLFTMPNGLPRIILSDIHLPNTEPDTFRTLFKWLYERQPPDYTTDVKLLDLMKLWVRHIHVRTGYGTFTDLLHPVSDIGRRTRDLENSKYGVEIGYGADATEVLHLSSGHGQMGV